MNRKQSSSSSATPEPADAQQMMKCSITRLEKTVRDHAKQNDENSAELEVIKQDLAEICSEILGLKEDVGNKRSRSALPSYSEDGFTRRNKNKVR